MNNNILKKIVIFISSILIFKFTVENILGGQRFPFLFISNIGDPGFCLTCRHFSSSFYLTSFFTINCLYYFINLFVILNNKIKASVLLFIILIIASIFTYFLNENFYRYINTNDYWLLK